MIRATSDRRPKTTTPPVPARAPLAKGLTYEQFLAWDGENRHVEWVNGEVIPMPPVGEEHVEVKLFLLALIYSFVEVRKSGRVLDEPFQMRTGPDLPGRSPDILFVARRNLRRLHRTFLEGPADLVVEVVSPDYRRLDAVEKFSEYERGGVREYWLVDPEQREARFFRLGRDGLYKAVPPDEDGVFTSAVLRGFWLKVDWLWQRPMPPVLSVLKEWGLV